MNPDSIPRYAPPTWAELDEMYRDPTPAELMGRCRHQCACMRLLGILADVGHEDMDEDAAARMLGCDECDEWKE